jgi:hypothetical protein
MDGVKYKWLGSSDRGGPHVCYIGDNAYPPGSILPDKCMPQRLLNHHVEIGEMEIVKTPRKPSTLVETPPPVEPPKIKKATKKRTRKKRK